MRSQSARSRDGRMPRRDRELRGGDGRLAFAPRRGDSVPFRIPLVPVALLAAAILVLPVAQVAFGAGALTNAWQAKIGTSGVNGTANASTVTTGVGSIGLKLVKLRASSSLPVAVYKGTCASVGPVLIRLAPITTTSAGAASHTSTLSAAQVNLILAATTATGKIAIRVGSGASAKCGAFAKVAVLSYEAVAGNIGPEGAAFGTTVYATSFASELAKKGLTGFKVEAERVVGSPGSPPYYQVERSFSTKAAAQAEVAKLVAAGYLGSSVETDAAGSP
jgi:hypothetical protein